MMVVTEVITWVALWFRLCPSVSTSLVMRERISPWVIVSKYFTGMRFIFSEISFRSRYVIFWEIPVIMYPCMKESAALTT